MQSKQSSRQQKTGIKQTLRRVWHFIWVEDSVWSWIVNVVLAFVIIKFLVYPGLGLVLGTTHPIVAVVSGSMEHHGDFDTWWSSAAVCGDPAFGNDILCTQEAFYSARGIGRADFEDYRFSEGFNRGDLIILVGTKPERVGKGDVIVFTRSLPDPVIHRVIRTWQEASADGSLAYHFQTKGDNNQQSYASPVIGETDIHQDRVIGKAVLRLPYLGWIKIFFVEQVLCQSNQCLLRELLIKKG